MTRAYDCSGQNPDVLGLRGARVFDGLGIVEEAVVVVDGSTVVGLEQRDVGLDVVDLGDVTLLPGLVDCHQHLCFDGNGTLEEQVAGVDDATLSSRARAAATRALVAGVTTVRDLGDRGYLTLELRDDPTLPTLQVAGPPITRPNGHCFYLGGECGDDAALRAAVAERAERGCDVVKVMVSGGALTPTFPMSKSQFDARELGIVVDEAHRRGLPVAAHCHAIEAIESALATGADTIEHCTFIGPDGMSAPDDDLIARLAAAGVAISLTVGRLPGLPVNPLIAANLDALLHARRRLHELGARVVGGTDAGIAPAKPHDILPHAHDEFVAAGMTTTESLRAMTSAAARAIGLGATKGRLAPGYDADLLAVRGDPFTDPDALLDVAGVWRAGVPVARA